MSSAGEPSVASQGSGSSVRRSARVPKRRLAADGEVLELPVRTRRRVATSTPTKQGDSGEAGPSSQERSVRSGRINGIIRESRRESGSGTRNATQPSEDSKEDSSQIQLLPRMIRFPVPLPGETGDDALVFASEGDIAPIGSNPPVLPGTSQTISNVVTVSTTVVTTTEAPVVIPGIDEARPSTSSTIPVITTTVPLTVPIVSNDVVKDGCVSCGAGDGTATETGQVEPLTFQPPTEVTCDATTITSPPMVKKKRSKKKKAPASIEKIRKVHGNYDTYPDIHPNSQSSLCARPSYFSDERIKAFCLRPEWFAGKSVLDIGCGAGYIAIALGELLKCSVVDGIDLDSALIHKARQLLRDRGGRAVSSSTTVTTTMTSSSTNATPQSQRYPISCSIQSAPLPIPPEAVKFDEFPWNTTFRCEDILPSSTTATSSSSSIVTGGIRGGYDVVLCLNVTMYVHMTRGDDGVKALFHRLYSLLKPAGKLILEFQPFRKYKTRIKLTEYSDDVYHSIQLFPEDFEKYLLRSVGFRRCTLLDPVMVNLKRPLYVFTR